MNTPRWTGAFTTMYMLEAYILLHSFRDSVKRSTSQIQDRSS